MEGLENIQVADQPKIPGQSSAKPSSPKKITADSAAYREITPRDPVEVSLRSLLAAGVHFGHQTSRWDPKMAPFIHSVKNGIHIINLPLTLQYWQAARQAIVDCCARGGNVLFVGTKKQAQDIVIEEKVERYIFNWP